MENFTSIIQPKLDYYTIIWRNSTLYDVLSFIDCQDCLNDFYLDQFRGIRGQDNSVCFKFNNVELSIPYDDFLIGNKSDVYDIELGNCVFNRIRLNISGDGLDFLRSRGFDVENKLRIKLNCFHITRVDIAFDFINYHSDFLTRMINHLHEYEKRDLYRVRLMQKRGGVTFSIKLGKERTVYLGSSKSDKFLRCYDKKRQFTKDGVWEKKCPYGCGDGSDIDSWFRLELQLRDDYAYSYLYGETSGEYYLSILKSIYKEYCFTEIDSKPYAPVPVDFWENLWHWELIPDIIQNANSVQYDFKPTIDKIDDFIDKHMKRIVEYVDIYGLDKLVYKINEYINYLSTPQEDFVKEYIRKRVYLSFCKDKNEYSIDNRCQNHIQIRDGIMFYKK